MIYHFTLQSHLVRQSAILPILVNKSASKALFPSNQSPKKLHFVHSDSVHISCMENEGKFTCYTERRPARAEKAGRHSSRLKVKREQTYYLDITCY